MITTWGENEYNEYGDKFAPFSLALYAHQLGFDIYGPECFSSISNIMNIHTAYSGLIGDGEYIICERPTLNRIQTWLREVHGILIECVYKQYEFELNDGYYCVLKTADDYSEYVLPNTYNKDYNLSLVSGLESGLDLVII